MPLRGVRPGEAEPQACSVRWGPGPAVPSPSPCEAEREAPGLEAKAQGDLRQAEPSASPLMQRIQTPAGSSAGAQPGLLFFWADTTPLPSVFPLLKDCAEQMRFAVSSLGGGGGGRRVCRG